MVHIELDVRERELIPRLEHLSSVKNTNNITHSTLNLHLGDIVLYSNETKENELVIIERKSVADLIASIKDGRYDEQAYRLNGLNSCHNHNIIFLIEGNTGRLRGETERAMFHSALFSIIYYKGFSVLHSHSLDESAYIIWNIANKLHREQIKKKKIPYYSVLLERNDEDTNVKTNINANTKEETAGENEPKSAEIATSSLDYCSVIKKVKKNNINAENIASIMLSQIPGISTTTAAAICSIYKTLPHLVMSLNADIHCLDNICIASEGKKPRKISKAVIEKIKEFMCEQKQTEMNEAADADAYMNTNEANEQEQQEK